MPLKKQTSFLSKWKTFNQSQPTVRESPTWYTAGSSSALPLSMQLLQSKLLAQYKGQTLDTIFSGEKISNDDGHHYYIQKQLPFTTPDRDVSHAALRLTSNLEILPGLGNKTAIRFRHNHIFTLDKIPEDSRFYPEAKKSTSGNSSGSF